MKLGGGGGVSIFKSLDRQVMQQHNLEKERNKKTLSIKWWSYFLRNNNDRKTEKNKENQEKNIENMGKQGESRKNIEKQRETGENV